MWDEVKAAFKAKYGDKAEVSAEELCVRIPTKPAMYSNSKPAGYSETKPAGVLI